MKLARESLQRRKADIAGAAIAMILTLGFLFCVVQPTNARNRRQASALEAAEHDRQHLASLQAAIRNLAADTNAATGFITSNPVRLLAQSDLNTRLADIASLAGECGLIVKDLKPGDSIKTEHFNVVPILMTGTGDYRDAAHLIHLLHDRVPDVAVSRFKLSGNPDQAGADCNYDLELLWRANPEPQMHFSTADVR